MRAVCRVMLFVCILGFVGPGVGCDSPYKMAPFPLQEARDINGYVMRALRDEVDDAVFHDFENPFETPACAVTGTQTVAGNATETIATAVMRDYGIEGTIYRVTGTLNYKEIAYVNTEFRREYRGSFTLLKGLDEYSFRWNNLQHRADLISYDSDERRYEWAGSFSIDGATYSYRDTR